MNMNVDHLQVKHSLLTVNFSISAWEARKQDKKATREVAEAHAVSSSVGRYHKDLLPEAPSHEAILKLRNAWRSWHYEQTLPWGDEGGRVMRSSSFMDYTAGFRERKDQWDAAVATFAAEYDSLVAQAELRLNTLFSRADYPDVSEVKRRFAVRLTTYPLPDANDFRLIEGIPTEEAQRLIAEAEAGINARVAEAVRDLWKRMHEVVSNMAQRLADPTQKFHNTLVSNIADMQAMVQRLNLTNDPEITRMSSAMAQLIEHGPETLRTAPEVRAATAAKAAELAHRMASYV